MSLKIDVVQVLPGYYEFALEGRLDTETYPALEKSAQELLDKQARGIRLNMAKLNYISSMGLRVILKITKELKQRKGVFQLVNMQPQIQKVMEIAAALPKEAVFSSIQEADAYFDAMQKKALGQSNSPE
jgi:anti-anti-sigma factor